MIHKFKLQNTFQLSQNYLHFYDKLEKCFYFMQNMYKLKHLKINHRTIKYLLHKPISDGGFWNMACNLVNKYGIVPYNNMRATYQSNNTKKMNNILNLQMRKYACIIRNKKNRLKIKNLLKKQYMFVVLVLKIV